MQADKTTQGGEVRGEGKELKKTLSHYTLCVVHSKTERTGVGGWRGRGSA